MNINQIYLAACLIGLLSASSANAAYTPYQFSGTLNPVLYSFTATTTGEIDGYFFDSSASFDNSISMLVNGVVTPESEEGLLSNHGSNPSEYGDLAVLGHVTAGDKVVFRLNANLLGQFPQKFYSDKSLNKLDGNVNHVYSTSFSQDYKIPKGTYLAFEDIAGGGDMNYHDENFVATNITTAVPEPETYVMMFAGLGLIGFMTRHRKNE